MIKILEQKGYRGNYFIIEVDGKFFKGHDNNEIQTTRDKGFAMRYPNKTNAKKDIDIINLIRG